MHWILLACHTASTTTTELREDDLAALQAEVETLQAQVDALRSQLDAIPSPTDRYTDEEAVAAVQNTDPFNQDEPNLRTLWSDADQGWWWLHEGEWMGDHRSDPPGQNTGELIELYHETTECEEGFASDDCNATGAIKMYVNGPRVTDNDWSEDGLLAAATRTYHTHASGLYLVSFGQLSVVSDLGQLIAPSGVHLEPHGAHQGLRIDGTANAGDNIRVDLSYGGKGLAAYTSASQATTCEALGCDCDEAYPLYLRGGRLHLEDVRIERSADQQLAAGVFTAAAAPLGVRRLVEYSYDTDEGVYAWCVFNEAVTQDSLVFLSSYGLGALVFSPALLDVWGPGQAPAACTGGQLITTSAGSYGYGSPPATLTALGGFRVVAQDADGPMNPADFGEDYPVISWRVIEPI